MNEEQKKIETLEGDIEELTVRNNAFLMKIKDFYEEVSDLRIRENSLENNLKSEKLAINKVRSKLVECEAMLKTEKKKGTAQQERLKDRITEQEKVHTTQQERLKNRINKLNTSYSFRIGEAFVNAVAKPGKNTIMLPFRFVSLIFEFVFARKDK